MTYAHLADIYDHFASDFNYDEWTEWYLSILKRAQSEGTDICDCGCGTGSIAVRLSKAGKKVIGIDLSEDMLRVASDKARAWGVKIRFVKQDMRKLQLPRPVDAVIAACDGVNYLTDEKSVKQFFASAFSAIKPGGALAFDISNLDKLCSMGKTYLYGEDREDATYLWMNEFSETDRKINMHLAFFVREADGRYRKFEETHVQRAHLKSEITEWLEEAGFRDITVYGGDEGESGGPGGKRMYITAKKPKA
ncbi:MAG: class I SAM-dependent methyltransferase [Clostridia bacterium]|nr:class I SAM-dependent methyltransferase [Clostridia bacterium]